MKKRFIFCALTLFNICSLSAQRVVIIGFDGFSAQGYQQIRHPNIDKMVEQGVLSLTTRPVMPSVTLPNWTSHLSGSGPEEHGVTNNSWTLENHELLPIDTDEEGYYPSIFKVLKNQVPDIKTAFYYNWAELINPMNRKFIDQVSFEDGDRYDSNYNKAYDFIIKNRKDPQLIFLYSVHTDHAGHKYGWMSPQYIKAVEAADSAVGDFLEKLKAADLYKDTHFLLITDHGGNGTKGHGGTSMLEMQVPWAVTGPKIRKRGVVDFFNSNKNTALVVARIFKIKKKNIPKSWTGIVPPEVFKK